MGGIDPEGGGSGAWMPGSRAGRGTPVIVPKKTPFDVCVALGSLTLLPSVAPLTVSEATDTRIPSSRSSWSKTPAGSGNVAVRGTAAGSGLPVVRRTVVGEVSSVTGGCSTSEVGTNSDTVAVTWTKLPRAAAAGGAALVKTKTPSDVAGSASTVASGSWMKNPLLRTPVTMPRVVTLEPTTGDEAPGPWMSWIGVTATSSLTMVPMPWVSPPVAPTTFVTLTKKLSLGSGTVSRLTVTLKL